MHIDLFSVKNVKNNCSFMFNFNRLCTQFKDIPDSENKYIIQKSDDCKCIIKMYSFIMKI